MTFTTSLRKCRADVDLITLRFPISRSNFGAYPLQSKTDQTHETQSDETHRLSGNHTTGHHADLAWLGTYFKLGEYR